MNANLYLNCKLPHNVLEEMATTIYCVMHKIKRLK